MLLWEIPGKVREFEEDWRVVAKVYLTRDVL